MAKEKFIGIKRLWYGNVFAQAVTAANLRTWLSTATEVTNSHGDTFQYSQDDPTTEDYVNGLTGQTYHVDKTADGKSTISFSIGEYEYAQKAELQGGTVIEDGGSAIGWKKGDTLDLVYKGLVGQTKTGNYVVFTNANIVAKADLQQKNITLGVKATAVENPNSGVSSEYWFTGSAVDIQQG